MTSTVQSETETRKSTKQHGEHSFPNSGELYYSKNKLFQELIIFVHFYEGHKRVLLRHIDFVNSLGFDAYAFNLHGTFDDIMDIHKLPISSGGRFGIKHVYADQIEAQFNLFSQKKIVYAFSNCSASAIEAMARRGCSDIVGMICDSGPGGNPLQGFKYVHEKSVRDQNKKPTWPVQILKGLAFSVYWSPMVTKDIAPDLKKFPKDFPLLSIRGWKDPLISPSEIDGVFEPHLNLDWQKLSLPEAAHLNGLRDFPEEYTPGVQKFLTSIAHKNS